MKKTGILLLCVLLPAMLLAACALDSVPSGTSAARSDGGVTAQTTPAPVGQIGPTGLTGALHKVYAEQKNLTAKVFAQTIADNAYLFAMAPPAPISEFDFKPMAVYYYHGNSDSVHFLGEYPLLAVRVVDGAHLALLLTGGADRSKAAYAFPTWQTLALTRGGTAKTPVFSAALTKQPFYAAVTETAYYAPASDGGEDFAGGEAFGGQNLISVGDVFDGIALLADYAAFDQGRMMNYGETPALRATLSYEEDGRVLTVILPNVVKSALPNGDLGIQNAFIDSATLEGAPEGAPETGLRLILRLTPYAKYYTLRAEAVFAPNQPAGTWLDADPATGKVTLYEAREQTTLGKLSLLFSPGAYRASGEERKITPAAGEGVDFHVSWQSYADPASWQSPWESLAYLAEPVNIPAAGGYAAFYSLLERRSDVVLFPPTN